MTVYRADHVGSLLRPPALLAARADPEFPQAQLRELEDRCIIDALQKQKDLGFQIFSDGELRRATFMSDFNSAVEGLDSQTAISKQWSGPAASNFGIAVERIRATGRMTRTQVEFLKSHSPGDIKITLPSANQFPALAYKKGVSDKVYASISEFLWDCVTVIKEEIRALVEVDRIPYVQIDAPRYSYFIDPRWRKFVQDEMDLEPEAALDDAIRADNASLEGISRAGVTICIHLCRGNNRSQWFAEGGYDAIAEKLFNELEVDAFSLEYDTERAGTFEPLRFVPKGKLVVLGLVSSKVPDLESADDVVKRIEEAAKYVPLEYLTLSPQCGFASMAEGNLLSEDDQWRKMELVAEVARRVWGTT